MKILDIYITEVCNLNCEYCYVDIKKKEDTSINVGTFTERIHLLEYDVIKFYGGEPLVKWKEIIQIVSSVQEKNKKIIFTVVTNGTLLSEKILAELNKLSINIGISLHNEVIKRIFTKKKLSLLYKYRNRIGFFILLHYGKETHAYEVMKFLSKLGFLKFSLNPITTDDWIDLSQLRVTLKRIYDLCYTNPGIEIEESNWVFLKNLHESGYCKKNQVDKTGTYKACNRFGYIDFLEDKKNIDFIDEIFDKKYGLATRNDRWFFVCNKGWYLDNFGSNLVYSQEKVHNFIELNAVLILFFKDIAKLKDKHNFLTEGLEEIRFNITNQCNLRCEYCYLDFNNKVLDVNIGKNIIDFFFSQDGDNKIISFFGGEPLLEFGVIEKLTLYAVQESKKYRKKVQFKIATNFLLTDSKKIFFFKKYHFNIHISCNGDREDNDISRDGSTQILSKKFSLLRECNYDITKITILYVVFPHTINSIQTHMKYFYELGFKDISFEIYLGEKYFWSPSIYRFLLSELSKAVKYLYENDIQCRNIEAISNQKGKYLDISTQGSCSDNSLEFFQASIDFTPKKMLDIFFLKISENLKKI
ncbi:radical SAM protein [Candidatus Gracilibacteria bacterium]|nr:radical SAM protein [Candidatus Gracilibacteria bacterium]